MRLEAHSQIAEPGPAGTDQAVPNPGQKEILQSFEWLKSFSRAKGRPLRVLHIGNIANNAYNNARIQRRYGVEADVLCFDYYHSMATPEWEDGGLTTAVDPALPDWWASNLGGFKRPAWFVQGPLPLCIGYLAARTKKARVFARLRRWGLESAYWSLLEDRAHSMGRKRGIAPEWRLILQGWISKFDPWKTLAESLVPSRQSLRELVMRPLAIAASAKPPGVPGGAMLVELWRMQRRARNMPAVFNRQGVLNGLNEDEVLASFSLLKMFFYLLKITVTSVAAIALFVLLLPFRAVSRDGEVKRSLKDAEADASALIEELRKREDGVSETCWQELHQYLSTTAVMFRPILDHYDIVQGYSIDGLIPFANGVRNFTAYEHGTLRDLPFENDLTGLRCRIAYRKAPISFITNSDVLPSVERLGLEPSKLRFLPHAFDETKLIRFRKDRPDLKPPSQHVRIFSPSRHQLTGEGRKGNDIFLRGAALAASTNRNFRITLVEWGAEVDLSKRLIDELGIADLVEWVQPMGKQALWQSYCTSHIVADQFVLPALGGVGFEALALGCRLLTRIDQAQLTTFFGECPPVLSASSPSDVASAITAVINDAEDSAGLGAAGETWIRNFHSAERIVGIQVSAYKTVLERNAAI
ncbi:glycosyltransferase [Bradyrhizobium mercantei]|uniref:glycosyltransferase n=1 Tax=Bradyrhizobium mercantei TaxID=1904807 RepID=UPI001178367D|nr:glycosyltransferase [Bradyrhizobium mercantei]